ncbi:MAG: hypothetical protein WDA24_05275 [Tissierellales bacterium]
MRRLRYKKFLKDGIIGYIQRIVITVLIVLALNSLLSLFLNTDYKAALKFSTLAVLIIGALSILGGMKTTYNAGYNYQKASTWMSSSTKHDVELLRGSYGFCIFMSISSGILYLIYLLI